MTVGFSQSFFKSENKSLTKGYYNISYTEWGDKNNDKVLFCVHGLSRNSRDFDYLARAMQDEYRVICIDVVGRGKSDWIENPEFYNYATYVSDAVKIIMSLNVKHVDWVGTSMGGLIGMMVAAANPDLVNKMVLNDIGPFIPAKSLERIVEYVSSIPQFNDKEKAEAALRMKLSAFGIKEDRHWGHVFEHGIFEKDGKYIFTYDPAIIKKPNVGTKIADVNIQPVFNNVRNPLLILRGAMSDVLLKETAEEMVKRPYDTELVEFDNIGHAPSLMNQSEIDVIKEWLLR